MWPPLSVYGILVLVLVIPFVVGWWLGVGAVRLRRWVRPMVLTLGTLTVVTSVLGLVAVVTFAPAMRDTVHDHSGGAKVGEQLVVVGLVVMLGLWVLLGIVFPGVFVRFYRSPAVKAMLEYYDPVPRWTDRCPVPALGVAVGLALLGAMALASAPEGTYPTFGTVLAGPSAVAACIGLAAVAFVLARLTYRRSPVGWWGAMAFLLCTSVGSALTLFHPNRIEMYRAAGYTPQELEILSRYGAQAGGTFWIVWLPMVLLCVGYLLYVRPYFVARAPATERPHEPHPDGPTG